MRGRARNPASCCGKATEQKPWPGQPSTINEVKREGYPGAWLRRCGTFRFLVAQLGLGPDIPAADVCLGWLLLFSATADWISCPGGFWTRRERARKD